MIRKFFYKQIDSITMAALLIALSSLISRLLGIFRDHVLAGEFGAGDYLDVYYAAFRLPDLIFNILILGALSAGFIPVFSSLLGNNSDFTTKKSSDYREAWVLASNVLNLLSVILLVMAVVGFLFSPVITKIIAPGYPASKQALIAGLTKVMLLSPLILGISNVFGDILQSFRRFFVYSLSPIFYNIGIIIGALYLVPIIGIYGLAWGVVLGAFLHLAVQVPSIINLGYKYYPVFSLRGENIKKILFLMPARTMSLAISQLNMLFITAIASTLGSGSLAVFNFANNLQWFPVGIFGISFATAAFPTFASSAFIKEKLIENFSRVARQILFFIFPATFLLLSLRAQIIRVVLGSGHFNWQDTLLTMETLKFFAISLFAQSLLPVIVRIFFARRDSSTPFFVGLIAAGINIILSIYFGRLLGVSGLALAFSLSMIFNFFVLWIILHYRIGSLDETRIFLSVVKIIIACFFSLLAIQGVKLAIWPYINMTKTIGVLTQALAAGTIGILVYLYFCYLFKSEEFFYFSRSIKHRLPWKRIKTDSQSEARGI